MATITAPRSPLPLSRRMVALLIGVVAEVALIGTAAYVSWGDQGENRAPLSLEDGLVGILIFQGAASILVLGAVVAIAAIRRWWGPAMASVLLLGAGFIGFVSFVLMSLSRQETSDC